jgi:hypothetical protein
MSIIDPNVKKFMLKQRSRLYSRGEKSSDEDDFSVRKKRLDNNTSKFKPRKNEISANAMHFHYSHANIFNGKTLDIISGKSVI